MPVGPYSVDWILTGYRIKDPKVSVPFYVNHFGMTLVTWSNPYDNYHIYILARMRDGDAKPPPLAWDEAPTEAHLKLAGGTAKESCIKLVWEKGWETDDTWKAWSGNTGRDGEGPLYAEEPACRGFGHIAFNCDDVYAACEKLEKNGVRFQKKPDEGRMKGLAFALDPDGYWIEIVRREKLGWPEEFNLSQTMMRAKDGPATVAFYQKIGMTLVREMAMPQWGFTNYFLVCATKEELEAAMKLDPENKHEGGLDPSKPNSLTKVMWDQFLEVTWNHGTEKDPDFKIHNGNDAPPLGFQCLGFRCKNIDEAFAKWKEQGIEVAIEPGGLGIPGIGIVLDPSGYIVEFIEHQ